MSPQKRAILAILDDIAATGRSLGTGPLLEPEETAEAWFLIERIERRLAKRAEDEMPAAMGEK